MPNFHPVTRTRHGSTYWQTPSKYDFAASFGILPLGLSELPKAITSLAMAFVRQGENFRPVALMSIWPDRNHYVTPHGDWPHGYIPAIIRTYPFRLFRSPEGRQLLCVDEESGLISDCPEGNSFFDDTGEPSSFLREVLETLSESEQGVEAVVAACAVLQRQNLIKPWPIKVRLTEGEKNLTGLYRIDEAALNQVSADILMELRNCGGLMMAYCQLLSMQHLSFLGELAGAHITAENTRKLNEEQAKNHVPETIGLEFLKSDGLDFGALR